MPTQSQLAEARHRTEQEHTGTFAVYRTNGVETDPETLEERPTYATVHANVAGKLKFTDLQPSVAVTPGVVAAETSLQWHTSVQTLGVQVNDEILCLDEPNDPELVGIRVRVTGPFLRSHATARRFPVQEIS